MIHRFSLVLVLASLTTLAETNAVISTDVPASTRAGGRQQAEIITGQEVEQLRTRCIEGRRYIAGRVVQINSDGIVVDSGYSKLLSPPFNRSWLVAGTASVSRDASLVEEKKADAICAGLVFLSNIPKRPAVKSYDYVVIHGYPAGKYVYVPAPGVEKTIRRFSASLDRAVESNLALQRKQTVAQ
jgi:hypothetical protein